MNQFNSKENLYSPMRP